MKLGATYKDSLTGFEGVNVGHVEYITGCNQTLIQPKCKTDGDFIESKWFDDDRLLRVGSDVVALPRTSNGFEKSAPRR